jgi:hypothetical protein
LDPVKDVFGDEQKVHFFDSSIAENPPSVKYDEVMSSEQGVAKWMRTIQAHGFCFVDGCPATPEATKELLERISFIRETHYGKLQTRAQSSYTNTRQGASGTLHRI